MYKRLNEKSLIDFFARKSTDYILDRLLISSFYNVTVYTNRIFILLDAENIDNPINYAFTKEDYFKALETYENTYFTDLPEGRPSKVIRNYNRKYLTEKFDKFYKDKSNKKINKYFYKKAKSGLIIFFVDISYVSFNSSGRIKKPKFGHRSLFLYNPDERKGYYVDPSGDLPFTKIRKTYKEAVLGYARKRETNIGKILMAIKDKLYFIVQKIMKDKYIDIEDPIYVCPQSKTKDKNCTFWTLYLSEKYVEQFADFGYLDIESILSDLYENYPEKEDLNKLIKDYKSDLQTYAANYREYDSFRALKNYI
jgi:hypothetical protein